MRKRREVPERARAVDRSERAGGPRLRARSSRRRFSVSP